MEGAGWRADDGVGTGTGSSGSSGILAKRISNTSCKIEGQQEKLSARVEQQTHTDTVLFGELALYRFKALF